MSQEERVSCPLCGQRVEPQKAKDYLYTFFDCGSCIPFVASRAAIGLLREGSPAWRENATTHGRSAPEGKVLVIRRPEPAIDGQPLIMLLESRGVWVR